MSSVIGRVQIDDVEPADVVERALAGIADGESVTIFYVNAHTVRLAARNERFAADLGRATLRVCDGYGPWWASRLLGRPLKFRMSPPDWVGGLFDRLPEGSGVYLLGDEREVVRKAGAHVAATYPHLEVATHHGFFASSGPEMAEVLDDLRRRRPHVLLVGLGHPRQEAFSLGHAGGVGVPVVIAVGALFKWWSGEEDRAPSWITDHGLEWLSRLIRHPLRYANRYVIGLPIFAGIVFGAWLRRLLGLGGRT